MKYEFVLSHNRNGELSILTDKKRIDIDELRYWLNKRYKLIKIKLEAKPKKLKRMKLIK